MNTQCPNCKIAQNVPNEYANSPIKCKECGQTFKAVIPIPVTTTPNPIKPNPAPSKYHGAGLFFQIIGGFCIFTSIFFVFFSTRSIHYFAAVDSASGGPPRFSDADLAVIDAIVECAAFLGIILSILLIALGAIMKLLEKK